MNFLATYIILPLMEWLISREEPVVEAWVKSLIDDFTQSQQNTKNVAAVEVAAKTGDHDALAKAEQDLLNGSKPSDSH